MSEINKVRTNNSLLDLDKQVPDRAKSVGGTKDTEEKFREVSELYEKYFIREMMKNMRATVQEGGFIKQNNAEKIFRDQLDDQYSEQWGKAGGIGLSKLIYDQLVQRYGEQMGVSKKIEAPQGPVDFNSLNSKNFSSTESFKKINGSAQMPTEASREVLRQGNSVTFKMQSSAEQRSALKNPWAGVLLDKKFLEMDQMQYRIKHDNGLESLMLTRGSGLGAEQQLSQGDTIRAGQQLGWLSPASPLVWTVNKNVSE